MTIGGEKSGEASRRVCEKPSVRASIETMRDTETKELQLGFGLSSESSFLYRL